MCEFLEALACETPLIACCDPEGIVSRFGIFVGRHYGTGLEALPALELAVRELLNDTSRRLRLGAEGRVWVNATHSQPNFSRRCPTFLSSPALTCLAIT